jgi:hypothetical protein
MGVNPGDKALERIIAELGAAIAFTGDPRLVELRQRADAMRTKPNELERLQAEQERAVKWRSGKS